jgi:hypothetical protein
MHAVSLGGKEGWRYHKRLEGHVRWVEANGEAVLTLRAIETRHLSRLQRDDELVLTDRLHAGARHVGDVLRGVVVPTAHSVSF